MSRRQSNIDLTSLGAALNDPKPRIRDMSMDELKKVQKTLFIRITRRYNASQDISNLIRYGLAKLLEETEICRELTDEINELAKRMEDLYKLAGKSDSDYVSYACNISTYLIKLSRYEDKVKEATNLC